MMNGRAYNNYARGIGSISGHKVPIEPMTKASIEILLAECWRRKGE